MQRIPQSTPLGLAELIELRSALPPAPAGAPRASLSERFLLPPFSVLDARQGYWQKRKRTWLDLGIQSELGRGEGANSQSTQALELAGGFQNHPAHRRQLANGNTRSDAIPGGGGGPNSAHRLFSQQMAARQSARLAKTYGTGGPESIDNKRREYMARAQAGATRHTLVAGNRPFEELDEVSQKIIMAGPEQGSGTSIFDPVLCEIAYRWFCPRGGTVLDPFAGGSVRGIVAAKLGRAYSGVDLRPEQAEANRMQAEAICPGTPLEWKVGDARDVAGLCPGLYDLVFSCPPYADLERYSDDPRDLSTMPYPAFLEAYRAIIAASCAMLRPDRFAVWVVGEVRDRNTGNYRGFVGDTIAAFRAVGLELYNDAVLVTAVGSLPIRTGKQFANYRKLGKTHQNVLVFLKGDAGRATAACGEVDVDDLSMPECVDGSVAMCRQDAAGTVAEQYLMGSNEDVEHLYLPPTESYLMCDIIRGQARAADKEVPRCWLGVDGQWVRLEDTDELTYLVGSTVYLNRALFPSAPAPSAVPVPVKKLRGT